MAFLSESEIFALSYLCSLESGNTNRILEYTSELLDYYLGIYDSSSEDSEVESPEGELEEGEIVEDEGKGEAEVEQSDNLDLSLNEIIAIEREFEKQERKMSERSINEKFKQSDRVLKNANRAKRSKFSD
jgi:hypothetical protein